MNSEKLLSKPLPSFSEWLGDDQRAVGYYEWVAETLTLERLCEGEDEEASIRIIRGLAVAFAEICRSETDTHGRDAIETCAMLSRCVGWAVMGPLVSILCDDAPIRKVQKMTANELMRGLRMFADSCIQIQKQSKAGVQ